MGNKVRHDFEELVFGYSCDNKFYFKVLDNVVCYVHRVLRGDHFSVSVVPYWALSRFSCNDSLIPLPVAPFVLLMKWYIVR